jgi:hypothetical protein
VARDCKFCGADISYYRLKQTDFDGKTSYSNLEAIEYNNLNNSIFNIYPNPNDGDAFNFQIYNKAEVLVTVYDMLGKEFHSKVIVESLNDNDLYTITPSQKLNAGVYLITVTTDNKIYNKRLIVYQK